MKWKIASGISDDVLRLCKKYKIGELQASILASRGNTEPDKVKFYLEKNISFMNNPFTWPAWPDERLQQGQHHCGLKHHRGVRQGTAVRTGQAGRTSGRGFSAREGEICRTY